MRKLILLIVVILVITFCIRVGVYFKAYHDHYAATSFSVPSASFIKALFITSFDFANPQYLY